MVRRAPHRAGRSGDPRRPRRGPEQGGHPGDAGPRGRGLRPALLRSSREPAASSRRLLRRRLQGPRPDARHPVRERLRAPPAAHDRARERRLPSFRQGSRLLGDGAPRRGLRGQAPDPGAAHRAGGRRAARGPRLPRLARRGRGQAHLHGGHGGLEPRHDRRHLRRPRPLRRGPRPPGRGDGRDKLEPLIGWEGNALTTGNPPSDGARVDAALVRRLIAARFPQWADLPVRPVEVGGWDNRTFHLGPRMTVRLPSAAHHAPQGEKEHRWLPRLAPLLPLPIPAPLARGEPGEGYPFSWSVYRWLDGEPAMTGRIDDVVEFAGTLAEFLRALRRIDPAGGPHPGRHNFFRGGPLTVYD